MVAEPEHGVDRDTRRTIAGTSANYLAALFQSGLFVFHVLAARLFGPLAYGGYVFAWSIVEMACKVGVMGMDKAMLRGVAAARAARDEAREVITVATGLQTVIVTSLGVILVVGIFALMQDTEGYRTAMLVLAPVVLTWSCVMVLVSATMATGTMRYNLVVRGIVEPGSMIALVVLVGVLVSGLGPAGVSLAHLLASGLTLGVACWAFARSLDARAVWRAVRRRSVDRTVVGFAFPVMLAEVLNQAIYRVDVVLVGLLGGEADVVARYGAAVLLAGVISSVRYAFDPILSPMVAEFLARGETARLADNLARMTRWVAGMALCLASAIAVYGDLFLGLWGTGFIEAHRALLVLCLAHLINATLGLHQWPVVMSGRSRLDLLNNAIAFVVILSLNLVLIPAWGMVGAATATLAGNIAFRGLQVVQVRRFFGANAFQAGLWRILAVGAVFATTLVVSRLLAPAGGWAVFALAVALAVGGALAAIRLMGLEPDDRAALVSLLKGVRKDKDLSP